MIDRIDPMKSRRTISTRGAEHRYASQTITPVILAVMLCAVGAVFADDADHPKDKSKETLTDPAAIAILEKVDKATKAVKSVRYEGHFSASGFGAAHLPHARGTAVIRGNLEDKFEYYFDVKIYRDNQPTDERLTTGGNGDRFFFIDWRHMTAHEGNRERIIGTAGQKAKWFLTMIEFIHPSPFTQEIEGNRIEMKDSALVGDVDCHVIHVVYGINGQEATWYFGKEDHLPRRVIRSFPVMDGDRVVRDRSVLNLEVDPDLPDTLFQLQLPEGFRKTNKPAPNENIPR